MRVTRRSLLSMIGLGAAAVALAPARSVGATEPEHLYTHSQVGALLEREREHGAHTGYVRGLNDARSLELAGDAITQARADGYNAGYTQAALRSESRQGGFRFLRQGERHS